MRPALRLLAQVGRARYLEPGVPTGLTGLLTSHAPRPHLLYLYNATLDKLQTLPESSAYRQSTEALTRHRLQLVEKAKPEGLEAWEQRRTQFMEANKEEVQKLAKNLRSTSKGGFIVTKGENLDEAVKPWDGEKEDPQTEGAKASDTNHEQFYEKLFSPGPEAEESTLTLEPEPPLTADQIASLENDIGAGLIEEVIQVAEGELKLVDSMVENRVWEELVESPPEGQWTYFERNAHTTTQKP